MLLKSCEAVKMPDQDKKLYDHLSGPQERYLNMYGPHSPANSDSPLSLVVRKEDHRKIGAVDSPGRSSGERRIFLSFIEMIFYLVRIL